jgi:SAM-dependent methyltransferase
MARGIPLLANAVNLGLRIGRNAFWARRAAPSVDELPYEFLAFLKRQLVDAGTGFTLVEVGCGDGRVLRELARCHPTANFVGVDIQKAAVKRGQELAAQHGLGNVRFYCASCLDDTVPWACDYLVSRTALIYLNRQELEVFLSKRLPLVRRSVLAHEIISLGESTGVSHFYANPIAIMAERCLTVRFKASVTLLDYTPWKNGQEWSGAELVLNRAASQDRVGQAFPARADP